MRTMKDILGKNKKFLIITFMLVGLTTVTNLVMPLVLQGTQAENVGHFSKIVGTIFAGLSGSFLLQLFLLIYRQNYAAHMNTRFLSELIKKMYQMKVAEYVRLEPTYLLNRCFTAVDALYLFVTSSLSDLAGSILMLGAVLIFAYFIHWLIFILLLFLIPLNYFGYRLINRKLQEKMLKMQLQSATVNKDLVVTLNNVDYVKQFADFSSLEKIFHQDLLASYQTLADTNKFAQGSSATLQFINQLCQNGLYLFVTYDIFNEQLPFSSILLLGILLPLFFSALSQLSKINIDKKTLDTSQLFITEQLQENCEHEGATAITGIQELRFETPRFSRKEIFSYPLSEKLVPGDVVYLKGISGSGKSSLLKLLLGFYEAEGITINGIPINDIKKSSLRQHICYVSQQVTILSRSLEENIGWGRKLTLEEKQRIEESEILAPILKTKNWQTILRENGENLSGGERQRIALARLLLLHADVYILDEATSSIDQESTQKILEMLFKKTNQAIFIYTSHDELNQRFATKIIQL